MSQEFLRKFLTDVPIWVWPLFVGLIYIGVRSTRSREVPIVVYYFLPLFLLMSVNQMRLLAHVPVAWVAFLAGSIIGVTAGFMVQKGLIVARRKTHIRVAGEWMTLSALMILFCSNFIRGTAEAIAPSFASHPGFVFAIMLIVSTASGTFIGRSARVLLP